MREPAGGGNGRAVVEAEASRGAERPTRFDWQSREVVIDPASFEEAMRQIQRIVGADHVRAGRREVAEAAGANVPFPKRPSAVVWPASRDEVQQIVRVANRYRLPLFACSTGRNWGLGSKTPYLEGVVTLVLERMNRIVEVDRQSAYAVIEPGVTYRQLNAYLREHGHGLWCDCTDGPPDGSVLGNALDRGIGLGPYSDHFGSLCGLEVVLPGGECVRTGGGRAGGSHTWNTYKWGIGPYLEGLFSQSNYGIVTQAGVWLLPQPEAYLSVSLELADEERLLGAIDVMGRLMKQGVLQGAPRIINDVVMLHVLTQVRDECAGCQSRLSVEDRAHLARKYSLPAWRMGGALYGTAEQVRANRRVVRRELSPWGTVRFLNDRAAGRLRRVIDWARRGGPDSWRYRAVNFAARRALGKPIEAVEAALEGHAIFKGIPSELFVKHAYFKAAAARPRGVADPVKDGCGLIWFAPILPFTSAHVANMYRIVEPLFEKYNCDSYRALLVRNERTLIALMCLQYRRDVAGDEQRVLDLYTRLQSAVAAAGYQCYRSAVTGMGEIYGQSPALADLVGRIKSVLDPRDILAPGAYGIRGRQPG